MAGAGIFGRRRIADGEEASLGTGSRCGRMLRSSRLMRAAVKWRLAQALCYIAAVGAPLHAQPFIYSRGILNAASYMPAGLSGGSIAQGSIFSIFGTGLGPATGVQVASFPLEPTLAGVSVKVSQGNVSVDAIPIYVVNSQLNVIMPSNAPLGRASVQVTYSNQPSNFSPVSIVPSGFGILTVNSAGFGPGVFTDASYQYITLSAAAKPSQPIILWGTGLGPIAAPDDQAPPTGNLPTQTEVFVGGQSAVVSYNGRAPCCSGLDQIVFTVPAAVPTGCWVPVVVRTGGMTVSNAATLAISADGSPCSDPLNPVAHPYVAAETGGLFSLHRVDLLLDQFVSSPSEPIADFAYARMLKPNGSPFFFNSLISLPPSGTCTIYTFAGDVTNGVSLPGVNGDGSLLDAGTPLIVSGQPLPRLPGPLYDQVLGSSDSTLSSLPLLFQSGAPSAISGSGGTDIGSFQADVTTGTGINWSNRDSLNMVDHTQALVLTFDPASASGSTVVLVGGNVDTVHNASAIFVCAAVASTGVLTVPAAILANVPVTGPAETQPKGVLLLSAVPLKSSTPFSATGLSMGAALFSSWIAKTVIWQ